jgi:hypothetical protein
MEKSHVETGIAEEKSLLGSYEDKWKSLTMSTTGFKVTGEFLTP